MKPGKKRAPETGTPVQVRLQPEELAILDNFRRQQPDLPGRAEAIRRMIRALASKERGRK